MFPKADFYHADFAARRQLRKWSEADTRCLEELEDEYPRHGFQLETNNPERVGMDAASDRYTPEQLVALMSPRKPRRVNWDRLQSC